MREFIVVTTPDGATQCAELRGEQLTVGSCAPAGLQIAGVPWLLAEHLLFAPRGEQCWAAVASGGPVARVDGKDFTSGYLRWNSSIFLGGVRIDLERRKVRNTRAVPADKGARTNPALLVALALGLAWFGMRIHLRSGVSGEVANLAPMPALFDAPEGCGEGAALHLGLSEAEAGDARRVRYVFAAQDGIAAVGHYQRAALCFEEAERDELAAEMRLAAEGLRRRIEADMQTAILALERALGDGDLNRGRSQCELLLEMLAHRPKSESYERLRSISLRLATASQEQEEER